MSDNTSWQDRQTNDLTLEELRQWRLESTKNVTDQRKHASTHNRYIKETIKDLESGERITTKKLEKLIASAKSKAGISAAELLEFTLGDTKGIPCQRQSGIKQVFGWHNPAGRD